MDWRERARDQAGTISRKQLRRAGLTDRRIDGLVARRDLVQVLPNVYAPPAVPLSPARLDWAAVLWSGGALSHRSAAPYWWIPARTTERPHVTVDDRRFRGTVRGVRVHRVRCDTSDVTQVGGLRVTTRARTVLDLMRTEPYGLARDLRDRALQQRWIDAAAIARSIGEQLGRTGNVQLRRLLAEIEAGAEAESERVLHRILRQAGLRGWVPQYRVRLGGRVAYLDVAFPAARLAIEVDGRLAHDSWSDRFDDDRARQNALIAAGWRVLRFTWAHLQDPHSVVAQIVQFLAA